MNEWAMRVVKIGGSLLDWEELSCELTRWLSQQQDSRTIFVVGGGALVESVRTSHAEDKLGQPQRTDAQSHWVCVDLMSVTANLVSQLFGFPTTGHLDEVESMQPGELVIFKVADWLRENEDLLPQNWSVTSDSIAATLATEIKANELVLLKSSFPLSTDLPDDYVDPYFTKATTRYRSVISNVSIRFVNLRDRDFPEIDLANT